MSDQKPKSALVVSRDSAPQGVKSDVSLKYDLLTHAQELLPDRRVSKCMRFRRNKDAPVVISYSPSRQRAIVDNVMVCSDIWTCPICASRISELRRIELEQGVNTHLERGGGVLMISFALQHFAGEALADSLDGLLNAYSSFWRNRQGRTLAAELKIAGRVRALEVTVGENGWHPHLHVLVFLKDKWLSPAKMAEIQGRAGLLWQHHLEKRGRWADLEHGLDIRWGDKAVADYVSKFGKSDYRPPEESKTWNETHELTKSHLKRSKKDGYTPINLLSMSAFGDEWATAKWLEYAQTMKGRRQLEWSNGLRELLNLGEEKTDEELPLVQDDDSIPFVCLSRPAWRKVWELHLLGWLIEIANAGDQWAVLMFLFENEIVDGVFYPGISVNDQVEKARAGPLECG